MMVYVKRSIRVSSLLWKAWVVATAHWSAHPRLQAIVYQQASIIVNCILVVADGHVEHGVS